MEKIPEINPREEFLKRAAQEIGKLSNTSVEAIYNGSGNYDVDVPEGLGDTEDEIKEIARLTLEERR
jgi:hypothetical protein